jgi:hypothetical protein
MNTAYLILCICFALIIIVGFIKTEKHNPFTEGFKSKKKKSKDPFAELSKITKFFSYLGKFFTWIGDIIKCGFETVIGLPDCFIFYVVDIFVGFFAMIIRLFCSFSSTLESARRSLWGLVLKVDKQVENFTGYHIIQWPDTVLKKCYRCRNKKMPKMPKM